MDYDLVPAAPPAVFRDDQARVNLTFMGGNGDLPDAVSVDVTDVELKTMLVEALRAGDIPGLPASPAADLSLFKVDRFPPTDVRPYRLIQVRPKTELGA